MDTSSEQSIETRQDNDLHCFLHSDYQDKIPCICWLAAAVLLAAGAVEFVALLEQWSCWCFFLNRVEYHFIQQKFGLLVVESVLVVAGSVRSGGDYIRAYPYHIDYELHQVCRCISSSAVFPFKATWKLLQQWLHPEERTRRGIHYTLV